MAVMNVLRSKKEVVISVASPIQASLPIHANQIPGSLKMAQSFLQQRMKALKLVKESEEQRDKLAIRIRDEVRDRKSNNK